MGFKLTGFLVIPYAVHISKVYKCRNSYIGKMMPKWKKSNTKSWNNILHPEHQNVRIVSLLTAVYIQDFEVNNAA